MPTPNWCGNDFSDSRALRQLFGYPDGVGTCALIGASGLLARERLGEEIDGHDFVIRLNLGPVRGYRAAVGSKTDLRIMNSRTIHATIASHCGALSRGDTYWCPRYPVLINAGEPETGDLIREACSSTSPLFFDSIFINGSDARRGEHLELLERLQPEGKNIMTGALAVVLATMLCPSGVDVYGFTHSASLPVIRELDLPYHYYDEGVVDKTVDTLDESARLLSELGEEQPDCVRLKVPGAIQGLLRASRARGEGSSDITVDSSAVPIGYKGLVNTTTPQRRKLMCGHCGVDLPGGCPKIQALDDTAAHPPRGMPSAVNLFLGVGGFVMGLFLCGAIACARRGRARRALAEEAEEPAGETEELTEETETASSSSAEGYC